MNDDIKKNALKVIELEHAERLRQLAEGLPAAETKRMARVRDDRERNDSVSPDLFQVRRPQVP